MSTAVSHPAAPEPEQIEPWPPEWLRATLSLSVLQIISGGSTYGYAIAAKLSAAGFGDIKGGTLYPLLGRLTAAELITENWQPGEGGPGRKYYEITAAGRAQLRTQARQWQNFSGAVAEHLRTSLISGSESDANSESGAHGEPDHSADPAPTPPHRSDYHG